MAIICTVGPFGQFVDVEDHHVAQWREIGQSALAWMDLHHFEMESPSEARLRRVNQYGADWATVVYSTWTKP